MRGLPFALRNQRASHETGIPKLTIWRVLCKHLHLKIYKLSMLQKVCEADKVTRQHFCIEMSDRKGGMRFRDNLIFSSELIFHISGKVNTNNCRIWGSKDPHETLQHEWEPKSECFLCPWQIYTPFFLEKRKWCVPRYA